MNLNLCSKPGHKRCFVPLKYLLVMKLIVLFITVACLQVSAKVSAQAITLSKNNVLLTDVFNSIKSQSGYRFFWKGDDLTQYKVSVVLKNANIDETMQAVLKDLPLTYTITEHTVVITQKDVIDKIKDKILSFIAPPTNISGIITSKEGEPIVGANVLIKRTKTGTTTDIHGFFTIKDIEPTDTLVISFIGYKTLSVPAAKNGLALIKMEEATSALDEVVIQGYGRTTQRTTTGNIGKVTAADIDKQPVNDPLLALEGKIAGVVVTPQTGYDDGPIKIEIRGRNALQSNYTTDPLYIIDGVPQTVLDVNVGANGFATVGLNNQFGSVSRGLDQSGLSYSLSQSPLYNINPQDIESIEVLKDADATAIYGSRGSNGVVLITTKKGKAGTNQFDLGATDGVNFVTRYLPMLNTQQYIAMRYQEYRNDGLTPTVANAPDLLLTDNNRYTDWQKYAYGGVGNRTAVQGTLSGGNELTTFRLSAGYNRTTDITAISGANQRATLAANITNTSPNKKLVTTFSVNYSFTNVNQINVSGVANLPPNAPLPYDNAGNTNFLGYKNAGLSYPFGSQLQPYNSLDNGITTNLSLNYNIIKGLTAGVSIGYNNNQNNATRFTPIASQTPYVTSGNPAPTGTANFGTTHVDNWVVEPQMNYNTLIGKGNFSVLIGGTAQDNTTRSTTLMGSNYTSDVFLHSIDLAPVKTASDNYGEYKYAGVFGRIGYNWESKYIVNLTGRRDGSSRFGPGKQFGNFGSVGAAWIASEEKWLQPLLPKMVTFLKFAGSYGTSGSDQIGDYQYIAQLGNSGNLTTYNGVAPIAPTLNANPNFHWSTTKKLDLSVETELLNGVFDIKVDHYINRTDDQLVNLSTPDFTGFSTVAGNDPANVQNSGWEFTLNSSVIKGSKFSWQSYFNIAFNHNVLLSYPNLATSPYRNTYVVGQPVSMQYVLNYAGVDPLTGLYTYTDHNNDGKINGVITVPAGTQYDDRYIAINREPDFTGGLGSTFTYKRLALTMNFSFAKQIAINLVNGGPSSSNGGVGASNIPVFVYQNSWSYPGQTNALYARASTGFIVSGNVSSSNAGYSDASYLRFQTVTLSYSLPTKILRKVGVKGLSFNVSTNNLFVITAYKGLDPEITTYGGLPPTRTVVSGLKISF